MGLLTHGRQHFGAPLEVVAPALYGDRARRLGVALADPERVADVAPLPARVHRGMWIVDCPDCRGAEMAWIERPVMMCFGCLNAVVGHAWRPVALPAQREEIERVLLARPATLNRNWAGHTDLLAGVVAQTAAELRAENRAHGLAEEAA